MERQILQFVEVLNLLEQFSVLRAREGSCRMGFGQDSYESAEKIQIALGRRQGKGIDLEVGRLKSYVEIRAVEQAESGCQSCRPNQI